MPCNTTLGKSRKTLTAKPLKSTQTSFPSTTRLLRSFLTISPLSRPSMSCPSSQKSGSQGWMLLPSTIPRNSRQSRKGKRLKRGRKEKSRWWHNNRRNEGLADLANSNLLPSPWYLSLHPHLFRTRRSAEGSRNKKTLAALSKDALELKQPSGSAQTNSSAVASSTGINSVDDRFAFSSDSPLLVWTSSIPRRAVATQRKTNQTRYSSTLCISTNLCS